MPAWDSKAASPAASVGPPSVATPNRTDPAAVVVAGMGTVVVGEGGGVVVAGVGATVVDVGATGLIVGLSAVVLVGVPVDEPPVEVVVGEAVVEVDVVGDVVDDVVDVGARPDVVTGRRR